MGCSTIDHVDWVVCLSEKAAPDCYTRDAHGLAQQTANTDALTRLDAAKRMLDWLARLRRSRVKRAIIAYGVCSAAPIYALSRHLLASCPCVSVVSHPAQRAASSHCGWLVRSSQRQVSAAVGQISGSCLGPAGRALDLGRPAGRLFPPRQMGLTPLSLAFFAAALTRTRRAQQFSVRLMSARGGGHTAQGKDNEKGKETAHAYCFLRLARDAAGTDRVPRRRVGLQLSNFEAPLVCNGHETVHSLTKQRQNHGLETALPSRPANLHC